MRSHLFVHNEPGRLLFLNGDDPELQLLYPWRRSQWKGGASSNSERAPCRSLHRDPCTAARPQRDPAVRSCTFSVGKMLRERMMVPTCAISRWQRMMIVSANEKPARCPAGTLPMHINTCPSRYPAGTLRGGYTACTDEHMWAPACTYVHIWYPACGAQWIPCVYICAHIGTPAGTCGARRDIACTYDS